MDTTTAQINMIKQQIRTWNVLDEDILELITDTPRELFVPPASKDLAYADIELPLSHHQVMMRPSVEARMIQALQIRPRDKILEIGTGSGYVTALLAKKGLQVYSVDIFPDLVANASQTLSRHGIDNVILQEGNGAAGWQAQQSYDVICITGSLPFLPEGFLQQLRPGGRLFAILGTYPVMEATLVIRQAEDSWYRGKLFETALAPLLHGREHQKFTF